LSGAELVLLLGVAGFSDFFVSPFGVSVFDSAPAFAGAAFPAPSDDGAEAEEDELDRLSVA
jgi:hypothetical protein